MHLVLTAVLAVAMSLDPGASLELGPAPPETVRVLDAHGAPVASVQLGPTRAATVHLPAGAYVVQRASGVSETVTLEAGGSARVLTTAVEPSDVPITAVAPQAPVPPGPVPPGPPPVEPAEQPRVAWRAPLMAAFVPGLGHGWMGKPGWAVGILSVTTGAVLGAVSLGVAGDRSDGATPSDASRNPGYARLGGLAALTSVAGALYIGQIFDAHRLEKGGTLRPRDGRVQLRFDRLSAVSMTAGRPRAALYDDLSLAALVRVHPRVRVGPADASLKLGPGQTVLQLGARAMARVVGPGSAHPTRRWVFDLGGGVLGQRASIRRTTSPLSVSDEPRREQGWGAVPYLMADTRLFVARRWSVGALVRLSVPLTTRRYARGRALPRYATTGEFGVSLGVEL